MKRKNRLTIYILLLVLVLLSMGGIRLYILSRQPLPARDYTEIKEEGILRIGVEYNRSSYYVSADTIAGLEYELCRAIEKISGLKVEIYPDANLANSLQALQEQRLDIIGRPMPITLAYKESFNFSNPITTNRLVLVQRNAATNQGKEPIRNQLELAKKVIYLPAESASRQRIQNLTIEIADTIFFKEDSIYGEEQLIMQVARGEIDYAICSETIARSMLSEYPSLDILTAIGFNQFRGWALRKDSPVLRDSLNSWLERILTNPAFEKRIPVQPKKK